MSTGLVVYISLGAVLFSLMVMGIVISILSSYSTPPAGYKISVKAVCTKILTRVKADIKMVRPEFAFTFNNDNLTATPNEWLNETEVCEGEEAEIFLNEYDLSDCWVDCPKKRHRERQFGNILAVVSAVMLFFLALEAISVFIG
jgi:hypothetical protein